MFLSHAVEANPIHESGTVVGNLLAGQWILAPLALLMLFIAIMI